MQVITVHRTMVLKANTILKYAAEISNARRFKNSHDIESSGVGRLLPVAGFK